MRRCLYTAYGSRGALPQSRMYWCFNCSYIIFSSLKYCNVYIISFGLYYFSLVYIICKSDFFSLWLKAIKYILILYISQHHMKQHVLFVDRKTKQKIVCKWDPSSINPLVACTTETVSKNKFSSDVFSVCRRSHSLKT